MMQTKIAILVLLFSMAYVYYRRITSVTWGPTVTTNSGGIRGIVWTSRDGREYYSWLKIPFAQPPIGPLRFATSVPVKKWEGVRDGNEYGSSCPQTAFMALWSSDDEDCLFLNVHAPKLETKKPLPVLVFVHGGAYILGSSNMMNPSYFMDEDVVIVSINYRLNVFGFLTTGDSNIRGNMGLKDQALALKWIHENVHHFGGDPNKMSIFGQSAGGSSVHYLTLSPMTKGLIKKVISMSGTSILPWAFSTTEEAVEKTKKFARDLNCPTENSEKMTECLRSLTVEELNEAYRKDGNSMSLLNPSKDGHIFGPTVEAIDDQETFLAQGPYDIIAEGKAHRVPWMSGVCKDEGLIGSFEFYRNEKALDIVENNWDKTIENSFQFSSSLSPTETADAKKKLREFYFPNQKSYTDATATEEEREAQISKYTKLFSDGHFLAGASIVASVQKQFSPVYMYLYTKAGAAGAFGSVMADIRERYHPMVEIWILIAKQLWNKYVLGTPPRVYGVNHAEDGVMFFAMISFLDIHKDSPHYEFSKALVRLYVDFARNDDETDLELLGVKFTPNKGKEGGPLMYLEVNDHPKMIPEPFAARTDFWRLIINYPQLFSSKKLEKK